MDDTKDTKDIKETGEAASVLSADEQMIQDGFNAFRRTLYNASYRRGSYRMPGDGFGLYLYLLCVIA